MSEFSPENHGRHPEGFSFNTIENFDDHIRAEIRGYDILDRLAMGFAEYAVEDDTCVYDIGCSTGRRLSELDAGLASDVDGKQVRLVGYEPSENLISQQPSSIDNVEIRQQEVDRNTKFPNASLVFSIFTLQFTPQAERPHILKNIYDGLNPEGMLILAEKVYASDAKIESMATSLHLDFKREAGSPEQIMDKERRLRRIMRPLSLKDNVTMLEQAGFQKHEIFWRVNNFVGLVAIK